MQLTLCTNTFTRATLCVCFCIGSSPLENKDVTALVCVVSCTDGTAVFAKAQMMLHGAVEISLHKNGIDPCCRVYHVKYTKTPSVMSLTDHPSFWSFVFSVWYVYLQSVLFVPCHPMPVPLQSFTTFFPQLSCCWPGTTLGTLHNVEASQHFRVKSDAIYLLEGLPF